MAYNNGGVYIEYSERWFYRLHQQRDHDFTLMGEFGDLTDIRVFVNAISKNCGEKGSGRRCMDVFVVGERIFGRMFLGGFGSLGFCEFRRFPVQTEFRVQGGIMSGGPPTRVLH